MKKENIENISSLIDESVLDELKSIMDDEFVDVLQVFLEESVNLMSEIHTAFEEDSENLKRAIHTFKSCSRNVGAVRLGDITEVMKGHIDNDDIASAKNMLDELQDVFTQSHAQIKKCMQDHMDRVA
jgi:histidine phosphotransfer protein HptB